MDIEWAKDGLDGKLYIVQARPETVQSKLQNNISIEKYALNSTKDLKLLTSGRAVGDKIGSGEVKVIHNTSEFVLFKAGDVLVADTTNPDWEPIMKKASAVVTNRGSRTCHAAIVAREIGVPAVVGCGNATEVLKNAQKVTVSCATDLILEMQAQAQVNMGIIVAVKKALNTSGIISYFQPIIDNKTKKSLNVTAKKDDCHPHSHYSSDHLFLWDYLCGPILCLVY